jgi:hypothetical protein
MKRVADDPCYGGSCPAIYLTDHGTAVVQGRLIHDSQVIPSEGEALVEIPLELLRQANA